MKKAIITAALIAMVTVFSNVALASPILVYENTGWILDTDTFTDSFTAVVTPPIYMVTLSDLSVPPHFGFDSISLELSEGTVLINTLGDFGSFEFLATLGQNYSIEIEGVGGGTLGAGLFGVHIGANPDPIPEPGTILLLSLGLIGLVGFRRKFEKK